MYEDKLQHVSERYGYNYNTALEQFNTYKKNIIQQNERFGIQNHDKVDKQAYDKVVTKMLQEYLSDNK